MKVYIHLEINASGVKTDKGCMQEFQTKIAAKEALRQIYRNALNKDYLASFVTTDCEFLRVADPHPMGKWHHWNYTIKRLTHKKQK